jgi:hypothetical protein
MLVEGVQRFQEDLSLLFGFGQIPEVRLELDKLWLELFGYRAEAPLVLASHELAAGAKQSIAEQRLKVGKLPGGVEVMPPPA